VTTAPTLGVTNAIPATAVAAEGTAFGPYDISGAKRIDVILLAAALSEPAHTVTWTFNFPDGSQAVAVDTISGGVRQAPRGVGTSNWTFTPPLPSGTTVTVAIAGAPYTTGAGSILAT
jgi:hypothetical protein